LNASLVNTLSIEHFELVQNNGNINRKLISIQRDTSVIYSQARMHCWLILCL